MNSRIYLLTLLLALTSVSGCGGQIAKTGIAKVTGVSCGVMSLQYCKDGSVVKKKIDPDNTRRDTRILSKNLLKPARYVETTRGSTLTFPCGKTVNYFEQFCD